MAADDFAFGLYYEPGMEWTSYLDQLDRQRRGDGPAVRARSVHVPRCRRRWADRRSQLHPARAERVPGSRGWSHRLRRPRRPSASWILDRDPAHEPGHRQVRRRRPGARDGDDDLGRTVIERLVAPPTESSGTGERSRTPPWHRWRRPSPLGPPTVASSSRDPVSRHRPSVSSNRATTLVRADGRRGVASPAVSRRRDGDAGSGGGRQESGQTGSLSPRSVPCLIILSSVRSMAR